MTWIFIRHAHRDTGLRHLDNGLSSKGRLQAKLLLAYWRKRFPGTVQGLQLYCSPKRRCMETIEGISKRARQETIASEELVEKKAGETVQQFGKRVQKFLGKLEDSSTETVVVCGHGDWLPLAVQQLCGAQIDLKKGAWVEIQDGVLKRFLLPDDLTAV